MLQPGRLARHAWRESDTVMTLVAAQETQTDTVVEVDPVAQAKAQYSGVKVVRPLGILHREQHMAKACDVQLARVNDCLLYTSDAADERSSVDLGGRRII